MKIIGLEFSKERSAKEDIPSKFSSKIPSRMFAFAWKMFIFPIRHRKSVYPFTWRFFS